MYLCQVYSSIKTYSQPLHLNTNLLIKLEWSSKILYDVRYNVMMKI